MIRFWNTTICLVALLLINVQTVVCHAQDTDTHSAYKVTTYNLGTIIDFEGATNVNLKDYTSLLIANSVSEILGSDLKQFSSLDNTSSAVKGFVLSAHYDATQQLALQGAFGIGKNQLLDTSMFEQKSSWEANLGLIYRLFPNLNYEVHLGYMETGDMFREKADLTNVDSIIMISNKLTMSF